MSLRVGLLADAAISTIVTCIIAAKKRSVKSQPTKESVQRRLVIPSERSETRNLFNHASRSDTLYMHLVYHYISIYLYYYIFVGWASAHADQPLRSRRSPGKA